MAGLGISRGGIVAQPAGGGGAPPGDATIWPFVANWAALSTVAGPLRDGDQVLVQSLGTGNSFGLAQYDEGDAEWKLLYGWFNSFANMEAFAEPIVTGGLAGVEASALDDETAVRYQYQSGWARTPAGSGYQWPTAATWAALPTTALGVLTGDTCAVTDADGSSSTGVARWSGSAWQLASAVFATCTLMEAFPNPILAGATCTITATTGPEVYRYQTFGSGIEYWAHSSVPDTLTRQAWGIGTEAVGSPGDPVGTLAGQGYTISTTGAGSSVAPSSGETLLTGGGGGGNNALLTVTGLSPVAGTVVYMRAFVRAGTAGTQGRGTQIGDNTQASRMYQIGAGGLDLYGSDGVTAVAGGTSRVSTALPAASGTPALLEILDRGATLMTTVRLNGVIVLQFRRNLVTTSAFSAVRWLALQSAVMGIRNHMVATV
jgi:hypothetical protein